jgi:hypothetical protein
MMLSIIVTMGFNNQRNIGAPEIGDEFDHMALANDADADFELVIVDRVWPNRWKRVQEAMAPMLHRVHYIPPKPCELISRGYRAVNSMRNSGAMCSRGDVLLYVDDYFQLDARAIERVCEVFETQQKLLCPVYMENFGPGPDVKGLSEFSGHNPGIYMCTRAQFCELGGYDENYDGSYGEADTDFQNRLDRMLWLRQKGLRFREHGVRFLRTEHANNDFPEERQAPWGGQSDLTGYLRCNRAFFRLVSSKRLETNDVVGNRPVTDEELQRLRDEKCQDDCGICNREDRLQQVESYRRFVPDSSVVATAEVSPTIHRAPGSYDPWR